MKQIASLLFLTTLASATTITDTVRAPVSGQLFTGTVRIQSPELTFGGTTYGRNVRRVDVTNGVFSESLVPNIGALPEGTTYRATFRTRDGVEWSEWWQVPDSSTALQIYQIRRASNPENTSTSIPIWKLGEGSGQRGRVLCSDGTNWGPCSAASLGPQSFTQAITSVTTVTITGATHGFNTNNLLVTIFDGANKQVTPGTVTINATTFDVVVTFTAAQTGRVVVSKVPTYSTSFTGQTSVTIAGASHGFATQSINGACFDGTGKAVGFGSMTVQPVTYNVTFTFATAQSGRCFVASGN